MENNFWAKIEKGIRGFFSRHGYTCDGCEAEIFDYPHRRLCADCEQKMERTGENFCPKCGRKKVADGVCTDCKGNLPKFTRGFSPFVYREQVAAMVNRMKNGNPHLALYFGEQMAEYFAEKYLKNCADSEELILVPVPLHKSKRIERGYNQSERLAESICERLQALGYSARVETDLLQKRKETAPQKQMTYRERMENVAGAYHVHKRKECKGKTILLIDDVLTTGATSSECAARLFGAGAKEVYFLVAAALLERR
ncbi:MAG: ComF family protein [Clostridia bacterium]|nr:ComF family protein [Clostridia bacterium]